MRVGFETIKNPGLVMGGSYRNQSVVLVKNATTGATVAMLTKHRNTKTDIHPWKVFTTGQGSVMLAAFWDDADAARIGTAFDYQNEKMGGKTAAKLFVQRHFLNR